MVVARAGNVQAQNVTPHQPRAGETRADGAPWPAGGPLALTLPLSGALPLTLPLSAVLVAPRTLPLSAALPLTLPLSAVLVALRTLLLTLPLQLPLRSPRALSNVHSNAELLQCCN